MAFFQPLYQSLVSHVTTSTAYLSREVRTNLQIKKISATETLIYNLNIWGC